jgi:hypothetical protein
MNSRSSDNRRLAIAFQIFAVAAAIAAFSLLIAVIRVGGTLVSGWVESVLRWLILAIGAAIAVVLVRYLWLQSSASVLERLGRLEDKYRDLAERMTQRKPTFVSLAAILALLVPFLFDKMVPEDDKATATAVGLALTVLFWLSNELLISKDRRRFVFGIIIWIVGMAIPIMVFIGYEDGDVSKMLLAIRGLPPLTMAAVVSSFLIGRAAPFTLKEH